MKSMTCVMALAILAAGCGRSATVVRGPELTTVGSEEYRFRAAPTGYAVLSPVSRTDAIHVPLTRASCGVKHVRERFFLESEYTPSGLTTRRIPLEHRVDHEQRPCNVSLAGVPASLYIDGLEGKRTATTISGVASFTVPDQLLVLSPATVATFATPEGVWRVDLRRVKALAATRLQRGR